MNTDEIKKLEKELAALDSARHEIISRMHYSTVDNILTNSGLPYTLTQEWTNDLGEYVRNYRYRWTSKWNSPASLYIQETAAGRSYGSMKAAINALEKVLKSYLEDLKAA
jgi:hypothetical protein